MWEPPPWPGGVVYAPNLNDHVLPAKFSNSLEECETAVFHNMLLFAYNATN